MFYRILCVCFKYAPSCIFDTSASSPPTMLHSHPPTLLTHILHINVYMHTLTHVSYGYLSLFRFTQLRDSFFPLHSSSHRFLAYYVRRCTVTNTPSFRSIRRFHSELEQEQKKIMLIFHFLNFFTTF